jgi:hypothetical protein
LKGDDRTQQTEIRSSLLITMSKFLDKNLNNFKKKNLNPLKFRKHTTIYDIFLSFKKKNIMATPTI